MKIQKHSQTKDESPQKCNIDFIAPIGGVPYRTLKYLKYVRFLPEQPTGQFIYLLTQDTHQLLLLGETVPRQIRRETEYDECSGVVRRSLVYFLQPPV